MNKTGLWPTFLFIMSKIDRQFNASMRKKKILIGSLISAIVIISIISLAIGATQLSLSDILHSIGHNLFPNMVSPPEYGPAETIVIKIRLPRILTVILVGTALGVAGTVMQGLLKNPLVSPFTLGVSSAASLGAVAAILFGSYMTFISGININLGFDYISGVTLVKILFAFVAGMISIIVILTLSNNRHLSPSVMVLSGVVLGYFFQAGVMFMKYISDDSQLRDATIWLMGGFAATDWVSFIILCPIVLITTIMMLSCSVTLNSMSCGEEVARNLGVNIESVRRYCLITITFATCACMSFTGVIGFIGLMAPHICRMVIGNDHRYLIPCSALMGSLILLISDTVGRVIAAPSEMPVGVIMYLLGGVFFTYLIFNGRGRRLES